MLELKRHYHARPPDVFRAFVSGSHLVRWFRPGAGVAVSLVAHEARPGGAFELDLLASDGRRGRVRGCYGDIVEPELVVFSFEIVWDGADPLPIGDVRVNVGEAGATTELVLEQELADGDDKELLAAAWSDCLDRLPAAFDDALECFYSRLDRQPRFRSRFGGFWTDLEDAETRLEGKAEAGLLSDDEAALFRHWIEKGYAVLPRAVSDEVVDRLSADVERLWREGHPEIRAEVFADGRRTFEPLRPSVREAPHKLLDLHGYLASARAAAFAPPIRSFLIKLFERPPLAFQSLYFTYGTEQDLHQDTAYVILRSPMEFCGCWIALEDVEEGAGELEYYEGSHRIPEYLWFGRARAKPYDYADDADYLRWVREEPRRRGLKRLRFRARKGDALLWHADLVHGGSALRRQGTTRRSLVVHLCPKDVEPEYLGAGGEGRVRRWEDGVYTCHQVRP